ncbi:MAG: M64 family metallopeptidase, partial [Planctomycetota bacterium]
RGRLVTSAEREADIARRKEEREAEKSAIAELRRLKRSRKITDYVAWAERLREGGSFELAQRILREIVDKASDEETAEARRLLEDPLLAVTTLADSGPSSNRVDFFFLGEGYQVKDDQQEAFLNSARACMKLFLNSEPYKEYQSYLSFHAAQLGSRDMGVDLYERGVERDTALDGRVEWQAFTVNNGKVMEILDRHGEAGADHLAIVIGNDYADVATGGGGVSCLSKAALSAVSHEVGHSLGGLRDEYDNPAGTNPNRKIVKKRRKDVPTKPRPPNLMEGSDRDDVLAHVIWRNWIDAGTEKWWNGSKVSIFEGGGYSPFNVWRPQASCMMRTSGSRFCVVCMEVMVTRIYRRVRPIDRVEPDEERLSLEEGGQLLIKVWPMKPETHYLDATWTLLDLGSQLPKEPTGRTAVAKKKQEGSLYKRVFRTMDAEGRVLECAQLRAKDLHLGFYRLRLRLHDPTPWVLRDDGGLLTQTRDWMIEIR